MNYNDETFAVGQEMFNRLGSMLKTKGEGELRAAADEVSHRLYDETGGKTRDLVVNGSKVGELNVSTASGYEIVDDRGLSSNV